MRLRAPKSWRVFLAGAMALSMTMSTAWADKMDFPFRFPGVDSGGNLSNSLGTDDKVKVTFNTSTGRFTARGNSNVQNKSRHEQTYNNVPLNIQGASVEQSSYNVKRNGRATATASGSLVL